MEPNTTFAQRTGSLGGTKIVMGIDESAIDHIMSVLTNLYSDPELAVIREISTNALDSHIAAGQKRPIEVTLPNKFTPFFRVKDYGVGLSVDDIENIYSRYGASTKRNTNTQTGMLGLGCKAPLTYTNQFNLIGVKAGVKTTVSIGRDEVGRGIMEIVDTCSTIEDNGVEIIVPVKLINSMASKATEFFRYWKPGTVLVNNDDPEFVQGARINEQMVVVPGLGHDVIVMGSVPYVIDGPAIHRDNRTSNFGVVAFVEMGAVNFVPSRESLHYTKRTNDEIDRLAREYDKIVKTQIEKDVNSAPTHGEAFKRYNEWILKYGVYSKYLKGVTYKGEAIPTQFKGDFIFFNPHADRYQTQRYYGVDQNSLSKGIVVHGYKSHDTPSTTLRRKMRKWGEDKGKMPNRFILTDEIPGKPWLDASVISIDEINAIKLSLPKPKSTKPARKGYWVPIVNANGRLEDVDTITTDDIVYAAPIEMRNKFNAAALTAAFPNATVVVLPQNRWEKFLKFYPEAKHYHAELVKRFVAAEAALTVEDRTIIKSNSYGYHTRKDYDVTKIDDPEVVRFLKLTNGTTKSDRVTEFMAAAAACNSCGIYRRTDQVKDGLPNPLTKYPLLSASSYNDGHKKLMEHKYIYMNAVYAAGKAT